LLFFFSLYGQCLSWWSSVQPLYILMHKSKFINIIYIVMNFYQYST
jgi:hypothetical protein